MPHHGMTPHISGNGYMSPMDAIQTTRKNVGLPNCEESETLGKCVNTNTRALQLNAILGWPAQHARRTSSPADQSVAQITASLCVEQLPTALAESIRATRGY